MDPKVITNNVPRDLIEGYELSQAERDTFDYIDWSKIEEGTDSATFFRFKGELYDLGEFSADWGITKGSGLPDHLSKWDGFSSDSFFSAVLVRYVDNHERVIVGTLLT